MCGMAYHSVISMINDRIREIGRGGKTMTDEANQNQFHSVAQSSESTFAGIKKIASDNIGQMLQDLQAFEIAIKFEKIPEIYRIYNGRLHDELDRTSNQNHEIDRLLAQKLHDSFMAKFPFMVHAEKVSETMNYYKLSEYYHQRPVIGLDSSIPEIFVIPEIDGEWQRFMRDSEGNLPDEEIITVENQMNELDAKNISAKTEIAKIDEELRELKNKEAAIENTKGFFNRSKVDEELEPILRRREELETKREEWLPYLDNKDFTKNSKLQIQQQIKQLRLKRAIVEKESRLLQKYFGGPEAMSEQLTSFLAEYLTPSEEVPTND